MAVLYKLQQDNRDTSQHKGEWYARAKMLDIIELDELAQLIQDNTTAKKADALAVLTEMVEQMKSLLKRSYAVRIPGLGIFKVGLKTSPAATAQEFTAAKNVKGDRGQERQAHHHHAAGRHRQGVAEECGGDRAVRL